MGRRKLATEQNIVWKRIELVFLVRTGQMSVREAAGHLNTSAKTYYAWERRILAGAKREATDRSTGRPAAVPNPELERVQAALAISQRQVAELTAELKALKLFATFNHEQPGAGNVLLRDEKGGRSESQLLNGSS